MPFNWSANLTAKAGQKAKEKEDEIVVESKSTEHSLKISLEGVDDGLEEIISEIMTEVEIPEKAVLTFEGPEANLKIITTKIAEIISRNGKQSKLDVFVEPQTH